MSVTTVKHTSKSSVQRFDVSHTFPVYNPDKQCKHLGLYTLIQITLYTSLCSRIKTRVPQVMQRTAKAHTSVWQKMSLIYTKRVYLCIMSLTHILTMQSQWNHDNHVLPELQEVPQHSSSHGMSWWMQASSVITLLYSQTRGAVVAQWLRCCTTHQKVAGSIPAGVIGIFHWHNPSNRTMALGSTQPLTEMSTRSISWG